MRINVLALLLTTHVMAQRYDSGSTGVLGDFVAPADVVTVLQVPPDGVFHYQSFTIAPRGAVEFRNNLDNTPVYILAVDTIRLDGRLAIHGQPGQAVQGHDVLVAVGGRPGPGGGFGGSAMRVFGFNRTVQNTWGLGPGGGTFASGQVVLGGGTSAVRVAPSLQACGGFSFEPPGRSSWHLFYGGSGGGGGGFPDFAQPLGGGGGAGQITLAAQRIEMNHRIDAVELDVPPGAAYGGGGTVRLVAGEIAMGPAGLVEVGSFVPEPAEWDCNTGPLPGKGLVRMEAFAIDDRALTFADSVAGVPAPAVPWRNGQRPALRIVSVNGQAVAPQPPERHPHLFPAATVAPGTLVEVVVEANYVPLGTSVLLAFNTNGGDRVVAESTPLVGNLERSTATASVVVSGQAELGDLQAWIPTFALPRP